MIYVSVCVGYDYEEDNFQYDVNSHLSEDNIKMYRKSLQTAHAVSVGWLYMSHSDFDTQDWSVWFEDQFRCIQFKELLQKDKNARLEQAPHIRIGLKKSFLWDGSKKGGQTHKDRFPSGLKSVQDAGQRAVFVEFEKGLHDLGRELLRTVLKSKAFATRCNIPMQLIPKYSYAADPKEQAKIKHTIQLHGKVLACLERDFNDQVYNFDTKNPELGNQTLQELLMSWKITNAKGVEDGLFKAIDPKWGNQSGYTFTFPAMEAYQEVARQRVKHLGPYLLFKYGEK